MAIASTTTYSNWLKDIYGALGPLTDQFYTETDLFKFFKRVTQIPTDYGNQYVIPLRTSIPHRASGYTEEGTLNTAGSVGVNVVNTTPISLSSPYSFTGQVFRRSRSNIAAFAQAQTEELNACRESLSYLINIQMWHDGTGAFARLDDDPLTGTELTVHEATDYATTGADAADFTMGTMWLMPGMTVDFSATKGGTVRGLPVTISSIQDSTRAGGATGSAITTGTIDTAVADDDYVMISTGSGTTLNINGMLNAIGQDTVTYLGINRSSAGNEYWKPYVDNTAASYSTDALDEILNEIWRHKSSDSEFVCFMEKAMIDSHAKQEFGNVRYTMKEVTTHVKTGYKGVEYISGVAGGCTIVPHRLCPPLSVWMVDPAAFVVMQTTDIKWLDTDGQVIRMKPATNAYDVWEAHLIWEGNFVCKRPRSCGAKFKLTP